MTTSEFLGENFNTRRVRVIGKTIPQPLLHSCGNLRQRGRRGFIFFKNVTDELLQAYLRDGLKMLKSGGKEAYTPT